MKQVLKEIAEKFKSRKLWVAIAGIATGIGLIVSGSTTEGVVAAVSAILGYLAAEGIIDAVAANTVTETVQNVTQTIVEAKELGTESEGENE